MRDGTAVAVVFVLVVTGLAACDGAPGAAEGTDGPARQPPDTARPSPTATSTDRALASGRAITVDPPRGGLVEIDVPSGRVVGEVDADLGDAGLGEGVGSLDHSPARHSVLFSRVITAASQEIVEVPLGGGHAQVLASGYTASMGPEGQRIAVGRRERGAQDPDRVALEIRTVEGQVLRRWSDPVSAEEPIRIAHLTWAPDGTRLAFEVGFEDGTEVRILDGDADDGSLQEASRTVAPPGDLRMLSAPDFRPRDGALVAVDGPGLDPGAQQRWRIVTVEGGPSEDGAVLVETDRAVSLLDFDHSGQHLLYVESHPHPPGEQTPPGPPVLFHWHDGTATEVTEGLAHATW